MGSLVKFVWFSGDDNNEISMHVLIKSICVDSYLIYQYQTFSQAKSKENDANKTHKIAICMLLDKIVLMM